MGSPLLKKSYTPTTGFYGKGESICSKCQQPIGEGQLTTWDRGLETHAGECPQPQPHQPPLTPSQRINQLPQRGKPKTLEELGLTPRPPKPKPEIIASVRHEKKFAGVPPKGFAFMVPLRAAGPVAFHLAKAGLEDFEVTNYEEDDATMFVFHNEPEHHVAEEIVREEFAQQIAAQKGNWKLWAPQSQDPAVLKSEHDLEQSHQMMSSEKTAEDSNNYLRGEQFSGPQEVPSRYEEALEQALSALDRLAEVGPSEDIAGCASMSAADLRQFAEDFKAGKARHFGADSDSEPSCCCVLGHLAFTRKK